MKKPIIYIILAIATVYIIVIPDLGWVQHKVLSGTWTPTSATLREVRISKQSETVAKKTFLTELVYDYEFGGQKYSGTDIQARHETFPSSETEDALRAFKLTRYPLQSALIVKVEAEDPSQSYILKLHQNELIVVSGGIMLAAVFVVLAVWNLLRPKAKV